VANVCQQNRDSHGQRTFRHLKHKYPAPLRLVVIGRYVRCPDHVLGRIALRELSQANAAHILPIVQVEDVQDCDRSTNRVSVIAQLN
jgi:hypothetical protein